MNMPGDPELPTGKLEKQQRHLSHPNYKPVPLRWPFLAALFLYACTLVALLEYGFRTLPVVQDRISGFRPLGGIQSTRTTSSVPVGTGLRRRQNLATVPEPISATPTLETILPPKSTVSTPTSSLPDGSFASANGTAKPSPTVTSGPTTIPVEEPYIRPTSFPPWVYQRPNHSSWDWLDRKATGRLLIANRQDEDRYGMLGPDYVLAHYALAFSWTHGPSNLLKTPVPPGVDASDRCVKHDIMGWVTNNTDDCPVLIPLIVWESPEFSGAFGPIRGGKSFLDADCRSYDADQVMLLDPYWDEPDCWADEVISRTIYHFAKTVSADQVTEIATRVVNGPNGPLTFVERTTLGSDIATITLDSSRVVTTTRARGYTNPVPGILTTLTNSLGQATATSTSFPFGFTQRLAPITLRDTAGRPTATTWNLESLSTSVVTLANEQGNPTLTLTEYSRPRPTADMFPSGPDPYHPAGSILYRPLSTASYFAGSFMPVTLTTLFAILAKTLHANVQALVPFHALTRPGGATAADSLLIAPGGIGALRTSWRQLCRFGEPVAIMADILFILSGVCVWLSSEAVGVALVGNCAPNEFYKCILNLAIVDGPARAIEGIVGLMMVLIVGVGWFLGEWRTGVAGNPWRVVGIAGLVPRDGETLGVLKALHSSKPKGSGGGMGDVKFSLEYCPGVDGDDEGHYCITARDPLGSALPAKSTSGFFESSERNETRFGGRPWALRLAGRLGFLGLLCSCSAIIIVYEEATITDGFKQFMSGQNFGSSFLFTALGFLVDLFWDEFYSWTTMLEPYRRLALRPQPAETSILASQSTTAPDGVWQAIRLRNAFGGAVAIVSLLSHFTPIFLANIPFRLTLTWTMHKVCAWLSVAILATMVVVLVGSFSVRWPNLPVEPRTISGCMYYVCGSDILRDLEHTSLMGSKEIEACLREQGRNYQLSEMLGESAT
ncbi:hypothetical protein OQA88_11879 [Cercophora sp. LCS_1]